MSRWAIIFLVLAIVSFGNGGILVWKPGLTIPLFPFNADGWFSAGHMFLMCSILFSLLCLLK